MTPETTPLPTGVSVVGAPPAAAPAAAPVAPAASAIPAAAAPPPASPPAPAAATPMAGGGPTPGSTSLKNTNWLLVGLAVIGVATCFTVIWYFNRRAYVYNDKQKETDLKMASMQHQLSELKKNDNPL